MKKKRIAQISSFMLTMLLLASCGSNSESQTNSKTAKKSLAEKQEFNFVVNQEMPTMDISLATDTISFSAMNNVGEGLYRQDKEGQLEPAGASKLAEKSKDGLTYTFELQKNAKWSDGKPVTAKDYVYSWQRTLSPDVGASYAYLLYSIKNGEAINKGELDTKELGVKAVDDYTLEVKLEKPVAYFESMIIMPTFFPQRQDIVEKYGDKYATDNKKLVYNGPFVLEDFDGPGTDTHWEYKANKNYWNKKVVKMDKINVEVIKEAPTALNLYQDGQADDVTLTGELAQQMRDDKDYVVQKDGRSVYMEVNQREKYPEFKNKNFRKALSYAIDRKQLVEKIVGDGSTVATGVVPAGLAYNPETKKDFVKDAGNSVNYDEKKAKEYWEKAKKELGITEYKFDILCDDTDIMKKNAEFLQSTFEEKLPGLKVTITTVPFSVRIDRGKTGDFEMLMSGWGADYPDPSSFIDLFISGNIYNRGQYSNAKYDEYANKAADEDSTKPEARWQDMLNAQKVIMDDMGIIPLYQKAEGHLRNPKIKGIIANTSGAQYDFRYVYKAE